MKKLTNRHFAINHVPQTLDKEAFRLTLAARPAVISFALGDPGDLVQQAHDVGSLVMLQVTTVAQAVQAASCGIDVIVAQGGEAGGYCGDVSTMALVPQVVDAVAPIPVVVGWVLWGLPPRPTRSARCWTRQGCGPGCLRCLCVSPVRAFPVGARVRRLLSSACLTHSVRSPERFRGGCSFGAGDAGCVVDSPERGHRRGQRIDVSSPTR